MKIGRGVFKLWRVENLPLPMTWPMAYTTWRFSTLHSSETPRPIFMKLEIYNYFQDTTPHAKFQGPTSTWVV